MTRAQPKIALSQSRDIPFDKLILSQSNVRHVKAGVDIEQLADDIARRTLLQSLTARPVLDESGVETGTYEIPAGGRRFRALEMLVKQRRLAKTAPIPCVIRLDGIAEEDSLAENVQRAPLQAQLVADVVRRSERRAAAARGADPLVRRTRSCDAAAARACNRRTRLVGELSAMCTDYRRTQSYAQYVETFSQTAFPLIFPEPHQSPNLMPQDEIRPTDPAPVFRRREHGVEMVTLRWGLVPAE